MIRVASVCVFSLGFITGFAQSIQNLSATFDNGKVIVAYDVVGAKPDQTYSLDLYSSHNNFTTPLTNVSGDVGKNIKAGAGKKIIWDAASGLGTFNGQVTFRVKGEMAPLPFVFKSPARGASARRGKNINILWDGGNPEQSIRLELFKGNDRVINLGETKNSGQHAWSIPKDFSKGTYAVRLTAEQEVKQSELFKVKARIPMLVKVLPILAAGGAAILLAGRGGDKTNNDLPAAPGPR